MRRLLALLLFALCLPAVADQQLFYQPLNRDARLSDAQWRQIWKASVDQGGKTLIVQWTAYRDDTFGGPQGWLAKSLKQAHAQGLQLVLGLHMDSAYYQRISEMDTAGLASYWQAQLGRSIAQQRLLRKDWQLPVAGWYLPLELDDLHFQAADRREILLRQLQAFNRQLDAPLHLSAFSAGKLAPAINAQWLEQLAGLNLQVWWQDGAGTGKLAPLVRQQYAAALPCRIGIIHEAFKQVSAEGQPFRAEPMAPGQALACHPNAVFELRYRPWATALLSAPGAP
ncbi:DUF4434 family protein [Pseudomonas fontis]|uniref:DUF4434 family protein n=1 Tax=Pseudomonas fontis TaxID=2942633 RepID=A0ABT5NPZ6_9PSED|nr:DUF4434 family protein [Pseudomonas fontis]MDD0974729.1 DUF4434 family protein [Pseudomonas fontis]MDD0990224.1 DUF4434 family protein [Pseudomonas fontis]